MFNINQRVILTFPNCIQKIGMEAVVAEKTQTPDYESYLFDTGWTTYHLCFKDKKWFEKRSSFHTSPEPDYFPNSIEIKSSIIPLEKDSFKEKYVTFKDTKTRREKLKSSRKKYFEEFDRWPSAQDLEKYVGKKVHNWIYKMDI